MARYHAAGGASDYTIMTGNTVTISTPSGDVAGKEAVVVGAIPVTWWNAETGGTQYTGLIDSSGTAVDSVLSSDGTDGRGLGQIQRVQYPDGVLGAWASAGGGPRVWMPADTSAAAVEASAAAAAAVAGLQAHVDASNRNPHGTASIHLTDFSDVNAADGMVPVWDADLGEYVPTAATGLTAADFVKTAGGSEIVIPVGDITTEALVVRIPPGDRTGAANTLEVFRNVGSAGTPNWQLVTWLDGYGQLRGRATAANQVYGQIRQFGGAQTANLLEFTDAAGNPLSWVDAAARFRAPNVGITPTWTQATGTAGVGTYRFYNPTGTALTLRGFIVSAGGTAPNGDFIINPKLDGVAVYASANRPKITSGGRTSGLVTTLSTTTWPAGSYLTVDVDAVPSTAPTAVTIQAVAY